MGSVELGMRAAEEPLRSDLDVKDLRAQVLGRIEDALAVVADRRGFLASAQRG